MADFATHSATLWSGALQAAATIAASHERHNHYDADATAERVLELAARIICKLPDYDSRVGASVAASIKDHLRGAVAGRPPRQIGAT
jgi:hypothetical protein